MQRLNMEFTFMVLALSVALIEYRSPIYRWRFGGENCAEPIDMVTILASTFLLSTVIGGIVAILVGPLVKDSSIAPDQPKFPRKAA